jgi:hypothetical protein
MLISFFLNRLLNGEQASTRISLVEFGSGENELEVVIQSPQGNYPKKDDGPSWTQQRT